MELGLVYIALAIIFGLFMAWGVGANDVANAMGTSVGSRALTLRQAIIIAIIFEAAGAIFAGGQVTNTIRSEIINTSSLISSPEQLIYGMLAALLAAGTWLLIASYYGWPVSTTHSIIGAIIGFGTVCIGPDSVHWGVVTNIFLSWIVTPIIACIIAYLLFESVQKLIFNSDNPFLKAKRYIPYYAFLVALVITLVTLTEGIKILGFHLELQWSLLFSTLISCVIAFIGFLLLRRIQFDPNAHYKHRFALVEKIFGVLMIFTACAMAFSHGSNDVANAIGPLAAVVSIVNHGGDITIEDPVPFWTMMLGAAGIVLGLTMYGHRVMATIGTNITQLTPSRGFAAQLATASTVIIASGFGLPVSTTQILVGAILGVGFARGMGALNVGVVRNILMSWIITVPAGAILAIVYYYIVMELFINVYPKIVVT
ncbi:MAG: inorganic phosphate transporter [Pseudomonadota bacterium]|nr:inorganic phosphate transporter [Pseudomonadota bacterium]